MSLNGDRAAVAALLSGVDGVTGYAYRPTTPVPGDAWPLLPSLELQAGLVWRPTWTIRVFLPQDEQAQSEWIDEHFSDLATALRGENFFPESAEPTELPVAGGGFQVVFDITIRSH